MKAGSLEHQFVKSIPRPMAEGVLYVSMEFSTAAHRCCCGCGNEVYTRLSPKDWQLSYDGRAITLFPSIGNWNFTCQSHYWIKGNRVVWDVKWSKTRIDALKRAEATVAPAVLNDTAAPRSLWNRLRSSWKHITTLVERRRDDDERQLPS